MTKHTLFSTLATRGEAWLSLPCGAFGIVQSIQREDGSGRSFNLTLVEYPAGCGAGGVTKTYYVRTID